uniref:Uncharacterized protein n=1 Tax=Microcebus murinus TaxID=30608 RepID=A0A8C5YA77_MICMU
MGKQKKTRKYTTMNLGDQRLKEKDRLKPKKKERSHWAYLTMPWLIPTLSTFPLKPNCI